MVELVQVVFPREDGFVGQHLSQDAAHRPDVNGLWVALRHKHTHLAKLWFLSFIYWKLNKLKRKKNKTKNLISYPQSYLGVEHDFWSPVPTSSHILSQKTSVVVLWVGYPCQAKVTDLTTTQRVRGQKQQSASWPRINSRVSESSEACSESYFRFRCSFLLCLICMQHSYFKWFLVLLYGNVQ